MAKQPTAIFVCGPTAVGKTSTAIKLAQSLKTTILSADSRQFYKEMKIGTARPTKEELEKARHHFIGHISIEQSYTVADFEREAMDFLNTYFQENDQIIIAGGSGLFVNALAFGIDKMPEIDPGIRNKLNDRLEKEGLETLQNELQQIDPVYFNEADVKNPRRVIRALEVYHSTGKTFSSYRKKEPVNRPFNIKWIGLDLPRDQLYDRINNRVDQMIEAGLIEEARSLYLFKDLKALQTVGYQELFQHFDGTITLDEAIDMIKKNSRNFAKRQLTWFRKNEALQWFSPNQIDHIISFIS